MTTSKVKRIAKVRIWPDLSGGQLFLVIVGKKRAHAMIFNLNDGTCLAVDRHEKVRWSDKYSCSCDYFKKCSLSIARYFWPETKLFDIGVPGAFKILEECATEDEKNAHE